jgi:hypothetical protein
MSLALLPARLPLVFATFAAIHWRLCGRHHDVAVFTSDSILAALASALASDSPSFTIVFAPDRYIPVHERPHDNPIHLSVDQLLLIHLLRYTPATVAPTVPNTAVPEQGYALTPEPPPPDRLILMMRSLNTTVFGTPEEQALGAFTRRKLRRLSNWNDWLLAEAKQLDSMAKQEMYGPPVHPPPGAIILRQHWNYSIKSDGTRKARNCCDGSPRAAPALKLANTYSSCIEQPCMRMFFALCAHEGYVCIKVDATNAYANSPPPHSPPLSTSTNSTLIGICSNMENLYRATRYSLSNMPSKATRNQVPYGSVLSTKFSHATVSSQRLTNAAYTKGSLTAPVCSSHVKLTTSPLDARMPPLFAS